MSRDSARQFLQGLRSFCNDQVIERDIAEDEDAVMELVAACLRGEQDGPSMAETEKNL